MASKAIGFLNFKFSADLTAFERAMKKAQKNLKKFGKNLKKTGQSLTTNLTLPILGLGAASLKFASDLQETDSKFKQVFVSIQKEAEDTAKVFQESFGLSELAAKQLLSDTGDLLVGFGFTEKAALNLSQRVNELAVDLASFTNFEGGAEGASKALTKALVGETESAKSLGIVIRQNTKEYKERTAAIMKEQGVSILQAKAINNLEIATSQSSKAIGDFARTSGDFANQLRILKGDLVDLAAELGTRLIPIAQKVIEFITGLVLEFSDLSESQKDNIVFWGLLLAAIGPVLIILGTLSIALAAIATPIGIVTAAIVALTSAIIYLKTSTSNIAIAIKNEFKSMANAIIMQINNIIIAFNKVSDFVNANPIATISYFELEEKSSGSGSSTSVSFRKRWQEMKKTGELALKQAKIQLELNKSVKSSTKGLITETKMYSEALETVSTDYLHMASSAEDQFKGMLFWTQELTEAQKAHNATVVLLEDIMFSAAMSAANSQEEFFKSFIENIKQAIKQLLIQLAVLTVISLLLGGSAMTIGKAFSTAKGKVLGLEGFADGGLVYGPTTALIGEGVGTTASNPEVVAPLDKLKQYMGGGNQNIIVEGVLKGNDIYLSNRNTSINRLRTS